VAPSSRAHSPAPPGNSNALRTAWIAVALIPVALLLAMVAGEGLIDALGYPGDGPDAPLWLALLVATPITLLAMIPAVVAYVYGHRARRAGAGRAATAAMAIGILVIAYWTVTFIAGVIQRLTG
jgi:hypothetical protein